VCQTSIHSKTFSHELARHLPACPSRSRVSHSQEASPGASRTKSGQFGHIHAQDSQLRLSRKTRPNTRTSCESRVPPQPANSLLSSSSLRCKGCPSDSSRKASPQPCRCGLLQLQLSVTVARKPSSYPIGPVRPSQTPPHSSPPPHLTRHCSAIARHISACRLTPLPLRHS
jgi:hypothetical protein